jgi:hypothetical protein
VAIELKSGASADVAIVDPTFDALRASNRPLDPGSLGAYSLSMSTGVMAAGLAANSEIFQFRWIDSSRVAVIDKVNFDGLGSITAFAAGVVNIRAAIARSWTVDGSGGTAASFAGSNQKMREAHGSSLVGAVRISSTAALTAGTKTIDAQDFGAVLGGVGASPAVVIWEGELFNCYGGMTYPIVLAQNQGIIVRATVPATGTWTAGISLSWTEVTAY